MVKNDIQSVEPAIAPNYAPLMGILDLVACKKMGHWTYSGWIPVGSRVVSRTAF